MNHDLTHLSYIIKMNRYIQRNHLTQPYQQNECKSPMLAEKCIYMHVFRKNKVKMIMWYYWGLYLYNG